MIKDIAWEEFKDLYLDMPKTQKGKTILIEDHDRPEWLLATFVADQETIEIPPEDVEAFYSKYRGKDIYRLIPEEPVVPTYLRTYEDDSEDLEQIQSFCASLVSYVPEDRREMAEQIAADIVGYFRIQERSGLALANIVLDNEKALEAYEGFDVKLPG